MKRFRFLFLFLIVIFITGCSYENARYSKQQSNSYNQTSTFSESVKSVSESSDFITIDSMPESSNSIDYVEGTVSKGTKDYQNTDYGKKFIRDIDISADVADCSAARTNIIAIIEEFGGYIENSNEKEPTEDLGRTIYLTVRVPSDKCDPFLELLKGEFSNVSSMSDSITDVTLKFNDTKLRLESLYKERKSLLELMERADNVSDIVEIKEKLYDLEYSIVNYENLLRNIQNEVDYTTINLRFSDDNKLPRKSIISKVLDDTYVLESAVFAFLTVLSNIPVIILVFVPVSIGVGLIFLIISIIKTIIKRIPAFNSSKDKYTEEVLISLVKFLNSMNGTDDLDNSVHTVDINDADDVIL